MNRKKTQHEKDVTRAKRLEVEIPALLEERNHWKEGRAGWNLAQKRIVKFSAELAEIKKRLS